MSQPEFDELLRRLVEAKVRFVLIGGLAVNAWGVVRGTKDVGIVADPDPENLRRLAEVAVAADGHVQTRETIAGSAFSIAALTTVAVCSLADLKTMKRAAGRTRDLADLEDLEHARRG